MHYDSIMYLCIHTHTHTTSSAAAQHWLCDTMQGTSWTWTSPRASGNSHYPSPEETSPLWGLICWCWAQFHLRGGDVLMTPNTFLCVWGPCTNVTASSPGGPLLNTHGHPRCPAEPTGVAEHASPWKGWRLSLSLASFPFPWSSPFWHAAHNSSLPSPSQHRTGWQSTLLAECYMEVVLTKLTAVRANCHSFINHYQHLVFLLTFCTSNLLL